MLKIKFFGVVQEAVLQRPIQPLCHGIMERVFGLGNAGYDAVLRL